MKGRGELHYLRLRATGGGQSHRVWVEADGRLIPELFDFSEDAHRFMGNDIADQIIVEADHLPLVCERLGVSMDASALLPEIQSRFHGYYQFRDWLAQEDIPHRLEHDPYA
jgi:hypothetical protein